MFTGIIREIGTVRSNAVTSNGGKLAVVCPQSIVSIHVGNSIAVNGICLTATHVDAKGFIADVSSETLSRTTLGKLRSGDAVNLELALAASGRLDGHIVQGHVDGVGTLLESHRVGESWTLKFSFPKEIDRHIVQKGSIAVDGISLTVAEIVDDTFSIAVIPHTYQETTLSRMRPGDSVNLEVDILAKYVEKMLKRDVGKHGITSDFLAQHGFGSQE